MRLIVRKDAEADIAAAYDWYERRQAGRGLASRAKSSARAAPSEVSPLVAVQGFIMDAHHCFGGLTMLIHGKCHCGNISFELDWQPQPSEIPARACSCSFCVKHGGVWTSCPTGSLEIEVAEPAYVSQYAFGTKTADFHVCSKCGVAPVVTSRIDGRCYAVVNVNTFEDVAPALLRRAAASFDDESEEVRLARRKRNWIGDVTFVAGRA